VTSNVSTVAFHGVEAVPVDVQVQISSGLVAFIIVGLPDKAVAESRERVSAALRSVGLALPARRITVNMAPADLPKEGSHYDLPIALALLSAMGVLANDYLSQYYVVGELGLDGSIAAISGALPAAMAANSRGHFRCLACRHGGQQRWTRFDLSRFVRARSGMGWRRC